MSVMPLAALMNFQRLLTVLMQYPEVESDRETKRTTMKTASPFRTDAWPVPAK